MLVENWMSTKVITINANDSMMDATRRLKEHGISILPVIRNGKLVGVLTDRDLKEASASDLEISKNTIVGSSIGISCENADPLIRDNGLSSNETAIYLVNSSSPNIERNTISENTTGIVHDDSSEPILTDNTMTGNVENVNIIPVANAGIDQTVEANTLGGASVTLDGSGSTDSDSTPGTNDDIIYNVAKTLTNFFGGCTIIPNCKGYWKNPKTKQYEVDSITIIESYTEPVNCNCKIPRQTLGVQPSCYKLCICGHNAYWHTGAGCNHSTTKESIINSVRITAMQIKHALKQQSVAYYIDNQIYFL